MFSAAIVSCSQVDLKSAVFVGTAWNKTKDMALWLKKINHLLDKKIATKNRFSTDILTLLKNTLSTAALYLLLKVGVDVCS